MENTNIKILSSPLTNRTAILAPRRGKRGGLTAESMEEKIESMNSYWKLNPIRCDSDTFLGLPYVESNPCPLAPGREEGTTREYARIIPNGKMIAHPEYIFPGQNGWKDEPWGQRVIDNMFPLADRIDFLSGYVYGNRKDIEEIVESMDAKGKDFMIISSPLHIVPAHSIDFEGLALLEQIFTRREIEDPDIKYVVIGSNNPGFPRKVLPKFMKDLDLQSLENSINGSPSKEAEMSIETLKKNSKGYYEPAGAVSGTSQPHPHDRVISLPILPEWVGDGYIRTEKKALKNGKASFYDYLRNEGFLIKEGNAFSLFADPVPEYNGGLLIIAKERQNIVDMNLEELMELGGMRRLARVMQEIAYDGFPSNDYMIQTFRENQKCYPNTRFYLSLVPRKNVHALVELSTKIVGINEDPKQVAEAMRNLYAKIKERMRSISNNYLNHQPNLFLPV